jgi:uncharacterized repeat protein (TIGR01451 family)
LRLFKRANSATIEQGDVFNYTFTVSNVGALGVVTDLPADLPAYNVTLRDTFPVGIAPTTKYWIGRQSKQQVEPQSPGGGKLSCACSTLHVEFWQIIISYLWLVAPPASLD